MVAPVEDDRDAPAAPGAADAADADADADADAPGGAIDRVDPCAPNALTSTAIPSATNTSTIAAPTLTRERTGRRATSRAGGSMPEG